MSEEDKALLSQSSTPTKPPKTETPAETKTDVPATDVKPTEKGVTDELLASVVTAPETQVAFSMRKGSIPVRTDVDASKMDLCAKQGLAIMKDKSRQLGNGELYLTPDQNGALADILTAFWNRNIAVEKVQKDIAAALKD